MSDYKLTYFNVKAIGEPIRLILKYMGKEFEDVRIDLKNWPELKPKTPFGKLPTLEFNGKTVCQSVAICRYLGEEAGLSGKNNWENLQIDMIADTLLDIKQMLSHFFRGLGEEEREKKRPEMVNETMPFYLERLDNIAKNNGGYLANGRLSWVDFYFVGYSETMENILEVKICEKYAHLSQLRKRLYSLPAVQKYISSRPDTF